MNKCIILFFVMGNGIFSIATSKQCWFGLGLRLQKNSTNCFQLVEFFVVFVSHELILCLESHQPQRHAFAILQHLYAVVKTVVAHEAFFRYGEVVVFALEGAF